MSYMPLASFLRASGEQPSNTAKSSRECAESHASETHLPALSTSAPRSDISDPVSTCIGSLPLLCLELGAKPRRI